MDDRVWSDADCYFSSRTSPGDQVTRRCRLETLALSKGNRFKYLFDFDDEWVFQCKVLQELDEETGKPVVIKRVGEAPEQYPQWEDDDEEWEEDNALISLTEWLNPALIDRMFHQLPMDGETLGNLHRYFDAAANLYGVIPASKLLEIYNSQNEPIPDDVFDAFVQILRHEKNDYVLLSREEIRKGKCVSKPEQIEVIKDDLLAFGSESYFDLIGAQGKKPYKILPREEFLCYAHMETYPGNLQSDAMLAYLRKKRSTLQFEPEEACQLIRLMMSIDCPIGEVLEHLAAAGLQFCSMKDTEEFMRLYQEMSNHTRMQVNRGYMPCELFDRSVARIPSASPPVLENQLSFFDGPQALENTKPEPPKVGRNDPCPCGSGLKYKKCCGKA